ncbi:hypothetical protein WMY93_015577 [Mugilogobius chulae]|uniref:Knl1 C-terminal RWD domain-containing protein n=1 Tax=Mugilogobius chulae TaxID=88201 RepID=A0AAW0NQY4_9GOBI
MDETQRSVDDGAVKVENENKGFLSVIEEKSIVENEKCLANSTDVNMTEAMPVQMQRNSFLESAEESQTTEDPISKSEVDLKLHPGSPQINTNNDDDKPVVDNLEISMNKDGEETHSRKSRRRTLAEIQSKIRRFSQNLNADNVVEDLNIPAPLLDPEPKIEETKQLMSRLSVVGFKPKLTKRSKSEEIKALDGSVVQAAEGKPTRTLKPQNQSGNFDLNVSDINDEELESYEDVSETLDAKQDSQTGALESDDNVTAAANTQTTNSSNCSNTTSLRCEATFESTSMQTLYDSSLDDYANDIQKKYDEGTLTMMEFFKLFHIDFVIHNPRQSVAPARVSSDTESTLMVLSYDRHVSLPKQLVYETDMQNLTEQVEGLKGRMRDLDKPLTRVNRTLWEEMEHFSEAEFKSFGAKLKEKHNFYRKMSRAKSHEMKEALYAELVQANAEEQNKLKGSVEKADAMLKTLDDAIAELEAELAAVECDVKSNQEELNKVTEAMDNNERATSELEFQKNQNLNKLRRVKEETRDLDRHLTMLHTINEWKLEEITSNTVSYTFLYKTLHLDLVYEESEGNDEERKIVDISFKHLFAEESQCHVHLVHTLVSHFTQDKSLTEKYPTSKHVPELLHDVSLVVSRCRQLGEEVRTLKAWCSLRYDIVHMHCLQSEIHVTFSSLKTFRKFEVVFSVSLTNQPYGLELKSFKNLIGNTTIQSVEEIVSSLTPAQKGLTKTIQNIHSSLLCF